MTDEKLYTVNEVAIMFRVTPQTIRTWVAAGKLGGSRINRRHRFTKGHLQAFVDTSNGLQIDPIARASASEAASGGAVL